MSKSTDFFKLGPYSRKNSRKQPGQIGRSTRSHAPAAHWERVVTRAGRHQSQAARTPATRARLCVVAVRLDSCRGSTRLAGDTCRRLAGAALLQPTVDACQAPVTPPSAARRQTSFFFFFRFLLCPLKYVTQSPFPIFISFNL